MQIESAAPFELPPKWQGIVAAVAGFGIFLMFSHFGEEGRGTLAGAFAATVGMTIRMSWPSRVRQWYLSAVAALIAVHIFVILVSDWHSAADWTGLLVMPIMAVDMILNLGAFFFVCALLHGKPEHLFSESKEQLDYRQ